MLPSLGLEEQQGGDEKIKTKKKRAPVVLKLRHLGKGHFCSAGGGYVCGGNSEATSASFGNAADWIQLLLQEGTASARGMLTRTVSRQAAASSSSTFSL